MISLEGMWVIKYCVLNKMEVHVTEANSLYKLWYKPSVSILMRSLPFLFDNELSNNLSCLLMGYFGVNS